ncbi:MAG: DUF1189 family protein [Candidatus Omnitrophica bacterium]|nr:DUF1189 family protein [Candidatus Omnitrophota bacterium]
MSALTGAFIPGFYLKILRQPIARTIKFLLFFILIISAALALSDALVMNPKLKYVQKWADDNLKKIPAMEVKAGTLIQPKEGFMLEMGNEFSVFAVEPDPKKQTDILAKFKNVVMLTQTQFVFKQTGKDSVFEEKRRDYDKNKDWKASPNESGFVLTMDRNQVLVTPDNVKKWLKVVSIFLFPAFLLVLFIIYCFTKPLQILFFSLVGPGWICRVLGFCSARFTCFISF